MKSKIYEVIWNHEETSLGRHGPPGPKASWLIWIAATQQTRVLTQSIRWLQRSNSLTSQTLQNPKRHKNFDQLFLDQLSEKWWNIMLAVLPVLSEHEIRRTSESGQAIQDSFWHPRTGPSPKWVPYQQALHALHTSMLWIVRVYHGFSHRSIDAVEDVFQSQEQTGLDFDWIGWHTPIWQGLSSCNLTT